MELKEESDNDDLMAHFTAEGIKKFLEDNFIDRKLHSKILSEKNLKIDGLYKDNQLLEDKIDSLKRENYTLISEKKNVKSELEAYKNIYIFFQDRIFGEYIFGDRLPQIKLLYNYLKENYLYLSTWGNFCFSLQKYEPAIFELNVPNKDFTNEDIGLILFKLGKYCDLNMTDFLIWLSPLLRVKTFRSNILSIEQYNTYINPYERAKKKPKNYDKINQVFDEMEF